MIEQMSYYFQLVLFLAVFLGVMAAMGQAVPKKKLPSISYTNIISCFPELKNSHLEYEVNLTELKRTIDFKYATLKSTMRYRKVIYEDFKTQGDDVHSDNSAIKKEKSQKRITLSLTHLKKGHPEYRMSIESLGANRAGEIISIPKNHEYNPSKEVVKSYLINTKIEEDESFWVDTKLNKMELSYKMINESLTELDFSPLSRNKQIKCEQKKDRGVLCICLKK